MAEYDFTHTIGQYLDRHLLYPLLQHLGTKNIYKEDDLEKAKLEVLSKTNMVDLAIQVHKTLYKVDTVPPEMEARREAVVARFDQLRTECSPILELIDNATLVAQLKAEKSFTPQYLQEKYEITPETIESLYQYVKFAFECGSYNNLADYLSHYRALCSNPDRSFSALWGKFASEILMQNWAAAMEDMTRLRDLIDAKNYFPLKQLQQRTWLIHWSLFVFFNHPSGRNGIIDMFFQDRYLNAIQTTCPHILRYLTVAVLTNKRKRNVLKDLVKVLQQESYTYRDPITEFLEDLYVNFDFEAAQVKLRLCERVLENDFFLSSCRDEFMENARLCIFETYCRIHQKIDIAMLAEKLNMDQQTAERWIVNLVRNARLDAKIDSAANHVIMGNQTPSVYQQVIEKTKGLSFRSYVLANNLSRSHQDGEENKGTGDQNNNNQTEVTA
jgi:translation initiation factor 3 subunit E